MNTPNPVNVRPHPGALACLLLAAVLLASALPARAGGAPVPARRGLETMTVNLYIGGGTETVMGLDPTDPNYLNNLVVAVTGLFYEVAGSQPALRMDGVAARIAARQPDIVGVEEATLIRLQSPGDLVAGGTTPATAVVFDYLQMLVDALAARGQHYAVVSTSDEWDIELPMLQLGPDGLPTGVIDDVRQTDREAILVRTDLPPGQLRVAHPQSGHFANIIEIPSLGFGITRGWCSIDVSARGECFRYVCTHLEEETSPLIQVAEARELLAGPARTWLPVVLVGDFNADPLHRDRPAGDPSAYPLIRAAGFCDSWAAVHPFNPKGGLTWGHDEFLADPTALFDRRIDFVFVRGGCLIPLKADAIDMALGRTERPLWASDHAALDVELLIGLGWF